MHDRRESDIVLAAQSGNRQAFGELVGRYQNMVTSMAFSKTGDLQRSEDIAQQAFLIGWEKLSELREADRFGGWIRAITRNVVLNSNRKSKRLDRSAQSFEPQHEPTTFESPGDAMTAKEQQELLWHSLKNIPEDYREPLILFYREDKSVAQVAQQMGLSVDAVKQRLSRGRAILKGEVEQFVEDLLGSTKPSASFSAAVLALLPAVSASAVGQVAIKGGSALGVKTMLGKFGILASGAAMGILGGLMGALFGFAGAWWGTKKAVDNATSEEEKTLLWKFFRTTIALTTFLVAAIIGVTFLVRDDNPVHTWLTLGLVLSHTVALIWLILRFSVQQATLHKQHGKPEYLKPYGVKEEATPVQVFLATLGATCGCWTWLLVLAAVAQQWLLFGLAAAAVVGILAWRWFAIQSKLKSVEVMRVQAKTALVNGVLIAVVILGAAGLGETLSMIELPTLVFAAIPFVMSVFLATMLWYGANQMERRGLAEDSAAS